MSLLNAGLTSALNRRKITDGKSVADWQMLSSHFFCTEIKLNAWFLLRPGKEEFSPKFQTGIWGFPHQQVERLIWIVPDMMLWQKVHLKQWGFQRHVLKNCGSFVFVFFLKHGNWEKGGETRVGETSNLAILSERACLCLQLRRKKDWSSLVGIYWN